MVATFHELSNDRSTVRLQVEYNPQGAVEPVGDALGVVSLRVQGDLERFKGLVEKRWVRPGRETIFDNVSERNNLRDTTPPRGRSSQPFRGTFTIVSAQRH